MLNPQLFKAYAYYLWYNVAWLQNKYSIGDDENRQRLKDLFSDKIVVKILFLLCVNSFSISLPCVILSKRVSGCKRKWSNIFFSEPGTLGKKRDLCLLDWVNVKTNMLSLNDHFSPSSSPNSSVYSHSAGVQQMAHWMFIVFNGKTMINSTSTGECCLLPADTVWQQKFNLPFCCLLMTNRFWNFYQNGGTYIYLSSCTSCSFPVKINQWRASLTEHFGVLEEKGL